MLYVNVFFFEFHKKIHGKLNIRFLNYKTIMSWALINKKRRTTTTKRQKITLRGAVNLLFYTFSFYDIFLLYLHCLYLFSCSNKINLKDFFCRMYVKTAILKWRTLMFWSLCLLWELNKWAENLLWRRLKNVFMIFLMNWKKQRNLWETKEMEDRKRTMSA